MSADTAADRLTRTYTAVRRNLLGFIRSRVRAEDDADDLLQEVFYQAVIHPNVVDEVDNLIGWLYRVATNKVIDWYRSRHPAVTALDELGDDASLDALVTHVGLDPEQQALRGLVADTVAATLAKLPDERSDAFVQQAVIGRTFREIADESATPINTLLSRKRATGRALRAALAELDH